jgi:nitrite reductase/ring-hydroxylating ferredoxin subunit
MVFSGKIANAESSVGVAPMARLGPFLSRPYRGYARVEHMTGHKRVTENTDMATRRLALGAGLLGLAAVAGCSGNGGSSGGGDSGGTGGGTGGGGALGTAGEVPVGGGKVFTDQKVVVTQPAQGEFKAFSAVCTHRGCTVSEVADGLIDCACHGSKFKIADGSVAAGPATEPLPPAQITVSGGQIRLA